MPDLKIVLQDEGTLVVDVRTHQEFAGGHVPDSINIPLNEIPQRINELRGKKTIVLCCASGGRSEQATQLLLQNGISCLNGGAWVEVNYFKNY